MLGIVDADGQADHGAVVFHLTGVHGVDGHPDIGQSAQHIPQQLVAVQRHDLKAGLEIVALDRNELLRDVLSALADIRVPIYTMNARQVENNCAVVSLTIGINNTEHLNRVVARLSKVRDVLKVTRS